MKNLMGKITQKLFGDISKTDHLLMQEITIPKHSKLTKKTKIDITKEIGAVVMGAKGPGAKRYRLNLPFSAKIKQGSILAMGTEKELDELEKNR